MRDFFHAFAACPAYNNCFNDCQPWWWWWRIMSYFILLYSGGQASEWQPLSLTSYPTLTGLQWSGNTLTKIPLTFTENWTPLTPESYLFLAISWSAVPEQPLDVTANGFPQGTTKKGIGRLQARYRVLGRRRWQCVHASPPSDSRTFPSPQKEPHTHEQSLPSSSLALGAHRSTFCFYGFTCSRVFSARNHTICGFFHLTWGFQASSMLHHVSLLHAFIPSYGYTSLEGVTGVFNFYFLAAQLVRSQFPDPGSNPCPCSGNAESHPPDHQGIPWVYRVFNLVHWWLFYFGGILNNNSALNIQNVSFWVDICFQFSCVYLEWDCWVMG